MGDTTESHLTAMMVTSAIVLLRGAQRNARTDHDEPLALEIDGHIADLAALRDRIIGAAP